MKLELNKHPDSDDTREVLLRDILHIDSMCGCVMSMTATGCVMDTSRPGAHEQMPRLLLPEEVVLLNQSRGPWAMLLNSREGCTCSWAGSSGRLMEKRRMELLMAG